MSKKTTDEQTMLVRQWWLERVLEGCPFEFPEEVQEGLDYKGELPWPKKVRAMAIRRDFERSRSMTMYLFMHFFERATGLDSHINKTEVKAEVNMSVIRPWYKLPPLPTSRISVPPC